MRARIDISEVEAQTKIRAKYLRALENEEWDLLPGSVYVKSFLKTYGSYLGLDSRLLIDEFKRRYERPMDHDQRPSSSVAGSARERELRERSPRSRSGRQRPGPRRRLNLGRLLSPPVVIVAVLLVIVAALALVGSLNPGGNGSANNAGAPTGPTGTGTTHTTQQTTTTTVHHKHKPRLANVTIVPTGTIYVCVKQASGTQVLAGTYAAGQTVPKVSGKTLLVTLGNANATMKVNGKPYTLTASSTPIGLHIDRAGVTPLSPGPTCS